MSANVVRKTWYLLTSCLFILLTFISCNQNPASPNEEPRSGSISISGAFALYPLMTRWAEEYQRINPGIRFNISSGGAGKGMEDVLSGETDIGMVSREITAGEETQGIIPFSVAKDAVFALINLENPVLDQLMDTGITREMLVQIFITGEIETWGEIVGNQEITDKIHVYKRSDICGAAATWGLFLGGEQEELLGNGRFGDPGMIQAVQSDPLGIGFNNLIYAYGYNEDPPKGTVILPIDFNINATADLHEILENREDAANAVATGAYPPPLSRSLYLVTKGKPEGILKDFLQWILTEGQTYVESSGYVSLPIEQLNTSLNILSKTDE